MKVMKIKRFLIAGVVGGCSLFSLLSPLFSAFKDPEFLARPAGMGGAFVAVSDDINAVWFNPAGISDVARQSLLFTYSKPYLNLDGVNAGMSYASYLHPFGSNGTAAVSWANFNTADLYQENTVLLSYGYDLNFMQAGVNLTYLGRSVTTDARTADDPVFVNGTTKSAYSVDAGVLKRFDGGFSLGASAKNLTQPDVGYAANDAVPAEYRLGAAQVFSTETCDIIAALDAGYRNKEYNVYAGGEAWFLRHTLAGRLGGNRNEASIGASYLFRISDTNTLVTHYSFSWPFSIEGSSGSHRLSLGIEF